MSKTKYLIFFITTLTLGAFTSPQSDNVQVYVYNSCSEDIRINYGKTCNGATSSNTAYSGKKTRFTVPKGGCLRYRGNGGSGQNVILGSAETDGQTFNIVDCKGY